MSNLTRISSAMITDPTTGSKVSDQIGTLLGSNTHSLQTTYTNGNLTQAKELDFNNNTVSETDVTYNSDGTVHTITEITNGKTMITTLNYVNGALDPVNPYTRSVS